MRKLNGFAIVDAERIVKPNLEKKCITFEKNRFDGLGMTCERKH